MQNIRNSWRFISVFAIALLVIAELLTGTIIKRHISDLRDSSFIVHTLSLQLVSTVGYGGLIHNFKNYLIRSDEPIYLEYGKKNVIDSLALIDKIKETTTKVNFQVELDTISSMVLSYSNRFEEVQRLANTENLSASEIDDLIRYNDTAAMKEIGIMLNSLETIINSRTEKLNRNETIFTWLSILSTFILGIFVMRLLNAQDKSRKYEASMNLLNEQLTNSNASLGVANTALRQFAGVVSHDLKAPIRHIYFFSELIVEDIDDTTMVRAHVNKITESANHMDSMIVSLLDFTETGFTQPKQETVNLNNAIAESLLYFESQIKEKKAEIHTEANIDVWADPVLLSRVFQNLISNSIKYVNNETKPVITILARKNETEAIISITDNGIGIASKYAEKIFEPLQRLHAAKSEYEGTGIGLSLSKSVIMAHGGRIWLDTEYTEGTRIMFTLKNKITELQLLSE